MINRIAGLFERLNNQNSEHPLIEWIEWIKETHPKLIEQMAKRINNMDRKDTKKFPDCDSTYAFVAASYAMMRASAQLAYDAMTGDIFGEGPCYDYWETLTNIEKMRDRLHEDLDFAFDSYLEEFKENHSEDDE